jgi:DNA adenine methylase
MQKAILKWAGGKRSLLETILSTFPANFRTRPFHEPFLGGGTIFFALKPLKGSINDINPRLINFYKVVRDKPEELITTAKKFTYDRECYYKLRDKFNDEKLSKVDEAALLLYLNKTGYNGLYRVNSQGRFNVPFGRYKNPNIVPEESIRCASKALSKIEIYNKDFSYILKAAKGGDLVYFDPPYEPLSHTSNFNNYSSTGFPWEEQIRLSETISKLDEHGVLFVLSNSEPVSKLYTSFHVTTVRVNRSINTKATARGPVNEIIVTNIKR